jgi:hypothetical protein
VDLQRLTGAREAVRRAETSEESARRRAREFDQKAARHQQAADEARAKAAGLEDQLRELRRRIRDDAARARAARGRPTPHGGRRTRRLVTRSARGERPAWLAPDLRTDPRFGAEPPDHAVVAARVDQVVPDLDHVISRLHRDTAGRTHVGPAAPFSPGARPASHASQMCDAASTTDAHELAPLDPKPADPARRLLLTHHRPPATHGGWRTLGVTRRPRIPF